MSSEMQELYKQRLGRYQAAIGLEPLDRIPIAFSTNYFAEKSSGYKYQQIMYDPDIWAQVEVDFAKKYPELDTFRTNLTWAPEWDVLSHRAWKVPGRDIPAESLQQYEEKEYMKADEYRKFIDNPVGFRMEHYFPRIIGEFGDKGSARSHLAFLKAGLVQGMFAEFNRTRAARLRNEAGMPLPTAGQFSAPFDYLSDRYRGLNGIMKDMFRQPDDVLEACEAVLPDLESMAMAAADPAKQLPIFVATHKPCFMSPKQFDKFYWPTFYKGVMNLIEAGWTFRIFLEGDWSAHWHHMAEFPKGKVLCDIDNEGDIFKAKESFGHQQCITGGIPNDMLILGTPEDIRERVQKLCATVGKDGGWIPNGGGHIPEDTKPENFKALLDSVLEYGRYSDSSPPEPKVRPEGTGRIQLPQPGVVTPWETVKSENGWTVPGDEELIKRYWDRLERMAYNWLLRQ